MRALWSAGPLLVLVAGCPEYSTLEYHIDLTTKRVVITARGLGTSNPAEADKDFASVAEAVADPNDDGFTDVSAKMYEENGEVVVRWEGTFDALSSIELYKHDRRSPYVWCGERSDTITSESGTTPEELPGCVVFDRKAKVLTFEVKHEDQETTSLLPQFRASQGQD